MKYAALIFFALMLVFSACKKSDDSGQTPPPADSAYYFQFSFQDSDYHLKSILPASVPSYANEIRGLQTPGAAEVPLIILSLIWPANHEVTDGDVLGLEGKTISLGANSRISFVKEVNGTIWHSVSGQMAIHKVTFIEGQTTTGALVLVHAISGTCIATMSDGTNTANLMNGSFNLAVGVLAR